MPNEQFRLLLESIASIAGIAALVAIALELQRARRADTRDFLSRAYEKLGALFQEKRLLASIEYSGFDEFSLRTESEAEGNAWEKMFYFWDLLTNEVKHNPSEKKIAIVAFGRSFYVFYEKWSPYLKDLQEIEGEGGYQWPAHMDWFASEYMRILPSDWDARSRLHEYYEELRSQAP